MNIYEFLNRLDDSMRRNANYVSKHPTRNLIGQLLSAHQEDLLVLDMTLGPGFRRLQDRFKTYTPRAETSEVRKIHEDMCHQVVSTLWDELEMAHHAPVDEIIDGWVTNEDLSGRPLEILRERLKHARVLGADSASLATDEGVMAIPPTSRPTQRRPEDDEVPRRCIPTSRDSSVFSMAEAIHWFATEANKDLRDLFPDTNWSIGALGPDETKRRHQEYVILGSEADVLRGSEAHGSKAKKRKKSKKAKKAKLKASKTATKTKRKVKK